MDGDEVSMDRIIEAKIRVLNMPEDNLGTGYLVARYVELTLWYYGFYDSYERALMAASEIGNGIVFGVVDNKIGGKKR